MSDTIIARATPPGMGGIGIVRISGEKVPSLMQGVIGKKLAPGVAYVGNFYDKNRQILDCGVALYFSAPHSFTGEHVLELQGHGGLLVIERILDALLSWEGIRLAEPGEFSRRAFLNGKIDLVQAESIADLIHAENINAVKGALRSLRGEFSEVIKNLSEQFLQIRSLVEASLDFSEESEIQSLKLDLKKSKEQLFLQLSQVVSNAKQGVLNRSGLNVVIMGKPNVGKSSLFNYLCGENRAIVTSYPGTTRDLLRETIYVKGTLVHLIDTAGLRETNDFVEQEGIKRAKEILNVADVVFYLQDINQPVTELPEFPKQAKKVVIFNKIDLLNYAPKMFEEQGVINIYLSIKERLGTNFLFEVLSQQTNEVADIYSARQRHVEALNEAKNIISEIKEDMPLDVIADELFIAHKQLMTITGEVVVDNLLDQIFNKFCIGK